MTPPKNPCHGCGGTGQVEAVTEREQGRPDFEAWGTKYVVCPDCGGHGTAPVIPLRPTRNGSSGASRQP